MIQLEILGVLGVIITIGSVIEMYFISKKNYYIDLIFVRVINIIGLILILTYQAYLMNIIVVLICVVGIILGLIQIYNKENN